MSRSPALLVLLALWSASLLPAARAEPLLSAAPRQAARAPADPGTLRARAVRTHLPALDGIRGTPGSGLPVAFFEDRVFVLDLQPVLAPRDGTQAFAGRVVGEPESSAVLVRRGDHVAANVRIAGRVYALRYRGQGQHEALEIDRLAVAGMDSKSMCDAVIPPAPSQPAGAPPRVRSQARSEGDRVDVLVVYTPAASASQGGAEAMASLADLVFAETNQILAQSGALTRLRLVHISEIPYVEESRPAAGQIALDLYYLETRNEGQMDAVHALRDTHGADLVSLWSNSYGAAGIAVPMLVEDPAFEARAFSVVVRSFLGVTHPFAHEVGHNLGLLHDHYSEQAQDTTVIDGQTVDYAFGYIHAGDRVRDLMAYPNACQAAGVSCPELPYYANPALQVMSPGGSLVPIGAPDANAVRAIDATRDTVSAFRDFPESQIGFALTDYVATEGDTLQLRLARVGNPLDPASVQYASEDDSARAGEDYVALGGSVSWANGETGEKLVQLTTRDDPLADGRRTLQLRLSGVVNGVLAQSVATIHIEDDEADAFPPGCSLPAGWFTPAGADAGWQAATGEASEGGCALRSAPIASGQRAQIAYTGEFAAGEIRLRRRVDSEAGWDFVRVLIDGQPVPPGCVEGEPQCAGDSALGAAATGIAPDHASRPTDWRQPGTWLRFPVGAGAHTLTISYEKDAGCCEQGADSAWLDGVYLPLARSLSVLRSGPGRVRSTPAGIDCGSQCSAAFAADDLVLLAAEADPGMRFVGWSGCPSASGAHCLVTLEAAQQVTASFDDPRSVPGAPVMLGATAGDREASVSFSPPASDGGSPLLRYTATSSPGNHSASCDAPCGAITVTSLANGTAYTFSVRATNLIGVGPPSAASDPVTPRAPQQIVFGPPPQLRVGATATVQATGGGSGNPVVFISLTAATCSTGGNQGETLTGLAVGSCTIAANQAGNAAYAPAAQQTLSLQVAPRRYMVTPSATANGSIAPDTPQSVEEGSTASFVLTPANGFSAMVVGTCGGELVGNTYTTAAVIADCSVDARFGVAPSAPQLLGAQPLPQGARLSFAPPSWDGGLPVLDYRARCTPGAHVQTGLASPIDLGGMSQGLIHRCSLQARNAAGLGPASNELSVVPGNGTGNADLSITKSNGTGFINDGEATRYLLVVANAGPDAVVGARVEDALAPHFASATWSCAPGVGAWCPATGSGALDLRADLPPAASVRIQFHALPVAGTAPISNVASVTPPSGIVDAQLDNNVAADGPDVRGVFRNGFE